MFKLTIGLATSLILGGTVALMASDNSAPQSGNFGDAIGAGFNALPQAATMLSSVFQGGQAFSADDLNNLVRIDDAHYQIKFSKNMSQDVIGSNVIKKVERGRTSFVNVVQTPTGSYSTDGLSSNHVQYYGITVRKVHQQERDEALAFAWARDAGWVALPRDGSKAIQHVQTENLAEGLASTPAQASVHTCDLSGSFACL